MPEVDHIKNVTIVGIGTQGSMIAFRNALYGKNVTGYRLIRMCMPEFTNLPRFLAPRNGSAHGYDEV